MAIQPRRSTVVADVGGVLIGSSHPVVVQSMTNTDTADVASTVNQVMALAHAGSELVRVTVNTEDAARRCPRSSRRWTSSASAFPSSATSTTTAICC